MVAEMIAVVEIFRNIGLSFIPIFVAIDPIGLLPSYFSSPSNIPWRLYCSLLATIAVMMIRKGVIEIL